MLEKHCANCRSDVTPIGRWNKPMWFSDGNEGVLCIKCHWSRVNKGKSKSPEHCAKMSAIRKGRKMSDQQRVKMTPIWANGYWRGKTIPIETRKKIAKTLTGKTRTIESRLKQSKSAKGKKRTIETRMRMSKAQKGRQITWGDKISRTLTGRPSGNKGMIFGPDVREKMSVGKKGKSNLFWKGRKHRQDTIETMRFKRMHKKVPIHDTIPELQFRKALAEKGIAFKTYYPTLGQPDIFIEPNWLVFVDGDYFHGNPNKYAADYFNKKVARFTKDIWIRDAEISRELMRRGFNVLRYWEHDIMNRIDVVVTDILQYIHIPIVPKIA